MADITTWPDSISFDGPDGFESGTGGGIGVGIFHDGFDAGFVEAHNNNTNGLTKAVLPFTTPHGSGGFSEAQVSLNLRLQGNDNNGVSTDREHRLHVVGYSTNPTNDVFAVWDGSLPDTDVWQVDLTRGPKVTGTLGSIVYPEGEITQPNHWWAFQNQSSVDWTTDGTDNDDPWPALTDAMADGTLVFEFSRFVDSLAFPPWTDGYVRVFEFTITIPGSQPFIPPLRLTNRADRFSSAPSLTRSGTSRQGGNRMTGYL